MSTSNDVREEVRARYAQAANAVTSGVSNSALNDGLQTVDQACGESSCCSGTAEVDGEIVTAGGRVLNVTALGAGPDVARRRAYDAADEITFEGRQIRTDIAARAVERAGA